MIPGPPSRKRQIAGLACAILVTLVLVTAPALGQAADPSASIERVTYTGDGTVGYPGPDLLLWHDEAHEFTARLSSASDLDGELCLVENATDTELGCTPASLPANSTDTVTVGFDQWPVNETGTTSLDVVLGRPNASALVAPRSITATVLRTDGDFDHDGLPNRREVTAGTDPRIPDTDDDGLSDQGEVTTYETSPVLADSDNDGLSDGAELRTQMTDPMDPDTDGDGLLDGRELELGTSPFSTDSDGDGLSDAVEVNTYSTDPTEADSDGDGLDDGTELNTYRTNPQDGDTDADGLSDTLEVVTYDTSPVDPDTDGDGLLDGAEVSQHQTDPTAADTDGDGLDDGAEVIKHGTNPLNADTDDDGLEDGAEVNRHGTDPLAVDTDGDGTSDRLEVQTGLFPDVPRSGLLAGAVLALVGVTSVVFWRVRRVPGRSSLASAVRTARRTLTSRDETSETDPPDPPLHEREAFGADGDVPLEFLPNEERVLRLLDEHDRQIRQSEIVEQTGWSKAKVSRVLSEMEENGEVTKIDIGRENVVARPEDVPSGAGAQFES